MSWDRPGVLMGEQATKTGNMEWELTNPGLCNIWLSFNVEPATYEKGNMRLPLAALIDGLAPPRR